MWLVGRLFHRTTDAKLKPFGKIQAGGTSLLCDLRKEGAVFTHVPRATGLRLATTAYLALLLVGCGLSSLTDEPLPTDGPNQVVLKVPRMT